MTQRKHIPLIAAAPVIFVLSFVIAFIISKISPHIENVNAEYVKANTGKPGFVLVDVRQEEYYQGKSPRAGIPGGHIPGAINFPIDDLNIAAASAALAHAGITKRNTIILYCNTGVMSSWFADSLVRKFNFIPSRIKNYRGGVIDWSSTGNILLPENHETGLENTN